MSVRRKCLTYRGFFPQEIHYLFDDVNIEAILVYLMEEKDPDAGPANFMQLTPIGKQLEEEGEVYFLLSMNVYFNAVWKINK